MKNHEVVNYMEISGRDVKITDLTEDEVCKISTIIQDSSMKKSGYRRKTA